MVLEHVVCEILVMIVGEILLNRRVVFRFGTRNFVEKSLHRITMLSSKLRVKGDTNKRDTETAGTYLSSPYL